MSQLVALIAEYGVLTVLIAAVLYIILRGEVRFRYPRRGSER